MGHFQAQRITGELAASVIPASQRNPKILIISSDTGGGHRSAAAAIVLECKNSSKVNRMPCAWCVPSKSRII
jgi:hypothetical protein